MKTSETLTELAKALVNFQAAAKPLNLDREVKVKTKSGGEYSFKYATFKNIKESTQKLLKDNGLAVSQVVGEGGAVTTILMHNSGEYIADSFAIVPVEQNPQAIGSAISYAKRYAFAAILGLVADDDDDANIAEGNQFTAKGGEKPDSSSKNNVLPWLSEKEKDAVLDDIRKGKHFEKTTEQLIASILEKRRMRKSYREEIIAEMESDFNKNLNNGNTEKDTEPAMFQE